nr:hypothetical protein [Tanacetum cinerariifolium]
GRGPRVGAGVAAVQRPLRPYPRGAAEAGSVLHRAGHSPPQAEFTQRAGGHAALAQTAGGSCPPARRGQQLAAAWPQPRQKTAVGRASGPACRSRQRAGAPTSYRSSYHGGAAGSYAGQAAAIG